MLLLKPLTAAGACRDLTHPRIVGLQDIFEIDTHTFATVLEVCRGGDLETYLRDHQVRSPDSDRRRGSRSFIACPSLSSIPEEGCYSRAVHQFPLPTAVNGVAR